MTKDTESRLETGATPKAPEHGPPRKPYTGPLLVEWGSILELTAGPFADVTDADVGGSGGV